MAGPLDGVRVLEVGQWVAGPLCGAMLGDLGADVVKVERPGGDEQRATPPHRAGQGSIFSTVNRGKRSIVLDLRDPDDRAVARELARHADVIVENLRPGALAGYGLDYAAVRRANERIVYCSVSGFGQSGPLAPEGGFDLVAQAMSGVMSLNGPAALPAHRLPIPIADLSASLYATIGVLAALRDRERTGTGQQVDVSLLEAATSFLVLEAATYFGGGGVPPKLGQYARNAAPYQVFQAVDGPIVVAAAGQLLWTRLCAALGCEELVDDERFATPARRLENTRELESLLGRRLATASADAWLERLRAAGVPAAPVLGVAAALEQPQLGARGAIVGFEDDGDGPARMLGPVVRLRGQAAPARAPRLDEDRSEILRAAAERRWPSVHTDDGSRRRR